MTTKEMRWQQLMESIPECEDNMAIFLEAYTKIIDGTKEEILQSESTYYECLSAREEEILNSLTRLIDLKHKNEQKLNTLTEELTTLENTIATGGDNAKTLQDALDAKYYEIEKCKSEQNRIKTCMQAAKDEESEENKMAGEKVTALKAVIKTLADAVRMKVRRSEATRYIDIVFLWKNKIGKEIEYNICLKDEENDSYAIVNPPPELQLFVEKFHANKDITQFLCNVRNYAKEYVERQEIN